MQLSNCKNANPKKVETRGFSRCPNPGFGFGKMSGLPEYPGFSKPGFQSLMQTLDCLRNDLSQKLFRHNYTTLLLSLLSASYPKRTICYFMPSNFCQISY